MNKNLYPHMKILQSKKLYLRPITLDDANDIFEYLSQENVVKYLPIKAHKNINETKKFISNYFINNYENNKYSHYAVVYKKENNSKVSYNVNKNGIQKKASSSKFLATLLIPGIIFIIFCIDPIFETWPNCANKSLNVNTPCFIRSAVFI